MKELPTRNLMGSHNIVKNPSLIKVRSMKMKDFEQLTHLHVSDGKWNEIPDELEILGQVGAFIVVRYGEDTGDGPMIDDRFGKIMATDYALYWYWQFMRDAGLDHGINEFKSMVDKEREVARGLNEKAKDLLDGIPQIFTT